MPSNGLEGKKGEEKPEEELKGNVSLLRGWQQHLLMLLCLLSP